MVLDDPSAENNRTIRNTSRNGHLAVVDRLLMDSRVDPSAENNHAIWIASMKGHVKVVNRLLQVSRIHWYDVLH